MDKKNFIIKNEKIIITRIIKLSENKLSIVAETKNKELNEESNIIFNKNTNIELEKFKNQISELFENNTIKENINSHITNNNIIQIEKFKKNDDENKYYQIFIYSINNFTLLYHINDIFDREYIFMINDIVLINEQKELIIAESQKLYIFNLKDNNFILNYKINNPITDIFNVKQSFTKIIIYDDNNFFITNRVLEVSENPICLYRRNKEGHFKYLYSIYYGNEPEGLDVLILSNNKFIFQLNESYEYDRGYFMIYDFTPCYDDEDQDDNYCDKNDEYNYFINKENYYMSNDINKFRKKIIEIKGNDLYKFNDKVILRNYSEFYVIDIEIEQIISHFIFSYEIEKLIEYKNNFYCIIKGDIYFMNMKIGKIPINDTSHSNNDYYSVVEILFFDNKFVIFSNKNNDQ